MISHGVLGCRFRDGISWYLINTNISPFLIILLHRSETGEYLALDLGGTNFRVLLITMKDGRMVDEVKLFPLYSDHHKIGQDG